ncbi:hypothetical protein UlMin_005046 [Ulmus minor]
MVELFVKQVLRTKGRMVTMEIGIETSSFHVSYFLKCLCEFRSWKGRALRFGLVLCQRALARMWFWFGENAGPWFVVRSLVPLQHLLHFLKQAGGISYSDLIQHLWLILLVIYVGLYACLDLVCLGFVYIDSLHITTDSITLRDLPLGIGAALSICCPIYMLISIVVVGLVPFHAMDPDTPNSSAFSSHGMQWVVYIIIVGVVTALCSTLMGSLLLQPRILMAMATDGLLLPFFSEGNKRTQVPLKSTEATRIGATILVSMLIVRYVPPDEVPLPSSLQESIDAFSLKYAFSYLNMHTIKNKRQKIAGWTIMLTCIGAFFLTYLASSLGLPGFFFNVVLPFSFITVYGVGGALISCGLIVLTFIDQDDGVLVWLLTGVLVYIFYGRTHSLLHDAVYVSTTHAEKIYCKSPEYVA